MASSTLYAMHVPGELATSAVRISLDESNTMAEIEQFMIVFNQLYQKFSRVNKNKLEPRNRLQLIFSLSIEAVATSPERFNWRVRKIGFLIFPESV